MDTTNLQKILQFLGAAGGLAYLTGGAGTVIGGYAN
jgi:hypothetical protein